MRCSSSRGPGVRVVLLLLAALSLPVSAQTGKLLVADGEAFDQFGSSVASGRQFVAVGAEFADVEDFNSGKVYVWRRVGGVLVFETELTPSETYLNDRFGRSVAADRNVLIVGSDSSDGLPVESRGTAHAFRRVHGKWIEEQRIVPAALVDSASFGWDVDVSGNQLIVGAPNLTTSFDHDGAAWIYRHDGTSWVEMPVLRPADPEEEQLFGHSVQIEGDVAVVAALGDSEHALQAGAVYIFGRQPTGEWVEKQKISSPDIDPYDGFGESVALDGEWLAIGTPSDDDTDTSSGAVYMYRRSGGVWTLVSKLVAHDGQKSGEFGRDVSLDGSRLAVGALNALARPALAGSVYMFEWGGDTWRDVGKVVPEGLMAFGEYGIKLDLAGGQLVAGAPFDDEQGAMAGAAFLVHSAATSSATDSQLSAQQGLPEQGSSWRELFLGWWAAGRR